MASVVDSIRAVLTDNYSMLKLGVFSYLIFLVYGMMGEKPEINPATLPIVISIIILYVGYCAVIIHNRITQNLSTLPVVNPLKFLAISFKAMAVLLPYLVIGLPIVNFVVGLFNFDGVPQQIAIGIIQLLVLSVAVTALIYYAKDYKMSDGYDMAKVFTGFQDVLVYVILCIIALLFVNIFIAVPVLYLTYSFFDIGAVFFYICIYLISMNLAFLADYCGQLSFDLDSKNNYY